MPSPQWRQQDSTRDERGRGERGGLTIDGEVVESDESCASGGHRWVGEGGAVEGSRWEGQMTGTGLGERGWERVRGQE